MKLRANLPIGASCDEQLQDLGFALRERNLVVGCRCWGLADCVRRRRWLWAIVQQLFEQAFESGFVLQQIAVKVYQQVSAPTVRHAAHPSVGMVTRDQLSGAQGARVRIIGIGGRHVLEAV
jgi:hypothetical protein